MTATTIIIKKAKTTEARESRIFCTYWTLPPFIKRAPNCFKFVSEWGPNPNQRQRNVAMFRSKHFRLPRHNFSGQNQHELISTAAAFDKSSMVNILQMVQIVRQVLVSQWESAGWPGQPPIRTCLCSAFWRDQRRDLHSSSLTNHWSMKNLRSVHTSFCKEMQRICRMMKDVCGCRFCGRGRCGWPLRCKKIQTPTLNSLLP